MSNYPPGVTGNEYEIAGPDNEWEEEFECTNDEFEFVMISPYAYQFCSEFGKKIHTIKGQEDIKTNPYHYASMINALFNMPDITPETQFGKCGFVGEVSKESYRGRIWWKCPQCGKEYEDEVERELPYDPYYGY